MPALRSRPRWPRQWSPICVAIMATLRALHWAATEAQAALERARTSVAELLGCQADEIVFTGGGSEANNLAIKGLLLPRSGRPTHVITSQIEHPAILEPCGFLERFGVQATY